MAIGTGDILRVSARLVWNALSDIANVWWMECLDDNSLSQGALLTSVGEFMEAIYTPIAALMANNATFADIAVSNHTRDEVYGIQTWPSLTTGARSEDAEPPGVGVLAWSPTVYPRVRGRKWFAPFTEYSKGDGQWDGTLTTAVSAGMTECLTPFTSSQSAQWEMKIPHFQEEGVELEPPVFISYSSVVVSNVPGYQRRRRPGSGS